MAVEGKKKLPGPRRQNNRYPNEDSYLHLLEKLSEWMWLGRQVHRSCLKRWNKMGAEWKRMGGSGGQEGEESWREEKSGRQPAENMRGNGNGEAC
jgi:hypothetical protein